VVEGNPEFHSDFVLPPPQKKEKKRKEKGVLIFAENSKGKLI
jgi:hypothetical protein